MTATLNLRLQVHMGWMLLWVGISAVLAAWVASSGAHFLDAMAHSFFPAESYLVWRIFCAFAEAVKLRNAARH